MDSGRILAVDYGRKRVGLAITDPDRSVVFPRGVLFVEDQHDAAAQILNYCEENQVVQVVIGIPYFLDMKESRFTREVKAFANFLAKKLAVPLACIDETLSSFEADELMEGIALKDQLPGIRDALSAKVILERWLDQV